MQNADGDFHFIGIHTPGLGAMGGHVGISVEFPDRIADEQMREKSGEHVRHNAYQQAVMVYHPFSRSQACESAVEEAN